MPQKLNSSQSSNLDYSNTEQLTGAKWKDGKPIYSKSLGATGPIAASTSLSHGITGIDKIINIEMTLDTGGAITHPGFWQSTSNFTSAFADTTNFNLVLGSARTGTGSFSATIYYTKV